MLLLTCPKCLTFLDKVHLTLYVLSISFYILLYLDNFTFFFLRIEEYILYIALALSHIFAVRLFYVNNSCFWKYWKVLKRFSSVLFHLNYYFFFLYFYFILWMCGGKRRRCVRDLFIVILILFIFVLFLLFIQFLFLFWFHL